MDRLDLAGERARDHVEDILQTSGHRREGQEYGSTWQIHEEGKGSVLFTALGLADTYSRPDILATASRHDFDPRTSLDGHGVLSVVTTNTEGERYAPYLTTLISAIVDDAETRSATLRAPLEPRLLLALDEADCFIGRST